MKQITEIKIRHIINHLIDVYGFKVSLCSIPFNNFHCLKRNFYIWIYNKVSRKLFYFLRDKVSPIKYLDERPSGEIWLDYRDEFGRLKFEIEVRPYDKDLVFYITDVKGIFKPNIDDNNYRVKIYTNLSEVEYRTFPMNSVTGIRSMDAHLSDFKELKSVLRESKLKKILK